MGHRSFVLLLVVAALVVGVSAAGAAEPPPARDADLGPSAVTASTGTLAYGGDFPDPFILLHQKTYWAYATGSSGRDLQVMSSSDLRRWSAPKEALAGLPSWGEVGLTWAPEVVPIGGQFVMYYTLRQHGTGLQCISVAVAPQPGGPFTDSSTGPLVCQAENAGSIDPSPFTVGQTRYLLWKSDDNAAGKPTHLWIRPLSADGLSWSGPEQLLLSQSKNWQGGIIEGPSMIASGGVYYLFYGAGSWFSSSAGIGYATCSSPQGPCTDRSTTAPWLGSRWGAKGPSGPATFKDRAGVQRFAYHAWPGAVGYDDGGVRALYTARLSFSGGVPGSADGAAQLRRPTDADVDTG